MPMSIDFPTKIGNATKPPRSDTVDHIMGVAKPANPDTPSQKSNNTLMLGVVAVALYFMYVKG